KCRWVDHFDPTSMKVPLEILARTSFVVIASTTILLVPRFPSNPFSYATVGHLKSAFLPWLANICMIANQLLAKVSYILLDNGVKKGRCRSDALHILSFTLQRNYA